MFLLCWFCWPLLLLLGRVLLLHTPTPPQHIIHLQQSTHKMTTKQTTKNPISIITHHTHTKNYSPNYEWDITVPILYLRTTQEIRLRIKQQHPRPYQSTLYIPPLYIIGGGGGGRDLKKECTAPQIIPSPAPKKKRGKERVSRVTKKYMKFTWAIYNNM